MKFISEVKILNRVPFYKYLGIYLDQSVSFKEHVTRLNNKISTLSSQVGLLSRVRNNLTVYAAERVFTTMILPKLDYCDFVRSNVAPSRYHSLERLQTKAARIVLKDSNLTHHQLLCQLSWKSLRARSTIHNLTFVFKCLHNIAPDLFKSYLLSLHMFIPLGVMI